MFGELGPKEIEALAARAVEVRLRKDEVLFVAGEEALRAYAGE